MNTHWGPANPGCKLAIVIPAYRARFLDRSLASLAAQEDLNFRVYVGDDASPELIEPVVRRFADRLSLAYRRFDENLGGKSLVGHWERCIALSEEPWVWLFSDDDVLEPECVAAFYRTLAQTGGRHEVYRFNTVIVDAEEQMAGLNPPHPECEPWQEFAYHLFSGSRACTAQEVIFSRETYARQGGFVDFPLAWCSDYASLIAFADNKPIRRIAGPLVRFRKSGQNLSSIRNRRIALLKLGATMEFVEWMLARIKGEGTRGFRLGQQALRESLRNWFVSHLMALHVWLGPGDMFQVASFLSKHWPEPVWMNLARVTKSNLSALVQSLRRRLKPDHAARRSHPALHPQHCPSRWRGLQVERAISVGKGVACS